MTPTKRLLWELSHTSPSLEVCEPTEGATPCKDVRMHNRSTHTGCEPGAVSGIQGKRVYGRTCVSHISGRRQRKAKPPTVRTIICARLRCTAASLFVFVPLVSVPVPRVRAVLVQPRSRSNSVAAAIVNRCHSGAISAAAMAAQGERSHATLMRKQPRRRRCCPRSSWSCRRASPVPPGVMFTCHVMSCRQNQACGRTFMGWVSAG